MPKLDLRNALRIKAQGGELAALKGAGFSWVKPDLGPPPEDLGTVVSFDFNDQTTSIPLRTYPGWTSVGTGTTQDLIRVVGQEIGDRTGTSTATPPNDLIVTDRGTSAFGWSWRMRRSAFASTADLVVSGTDRSNWVRLALAAPGGVVNLNKFVAGVNSTTGITRTNNVTAPVSPQIGETIEIRVFPALGIVEYYRNEQLETTWSNIDSSTAAVWGGLFGFSTNNTARGWDDLVFRSLSNRLTVGAFAQQAYSSDYINNATSVSDFTGADYVASFTYSTAGTAPTAMQYRTRKRAAPYAVITDWADCTAFSASAGSGTATLRLPVDFGIVAELRFRNDISTASQTPNQTMCGMTIACYGQSNAAFASSSGLTNRAFEPSATLTNADITQLTLATANWDATRFTAMRTAAGILAAQLGIPVIATGGGVGSQFIIALDPQNTSGVTFPDANNGGNDTPWNLLKKKFSQGGKNQLGRIAALTWLQGEAEMAATPLADGAYYAERLTAIKDGYRAELGNGNSPWFYPFVVGRENVTPSGNQNENARIIRAAQFNFENLGDNVAVAGSLIGIQLVDTSHYANDTQWGSEEIGKRWALTILRRQFGLISFDGRGPYIESGSRSGVVIELPITANGATSFGAFDGTAPATSANASALTGWEVSADDFATLLTIISVQLVEKTPGEWVVRITLAADPGGEVKVRSAYGRNPAVSSWVYGTIPGYSRISLEPLYNWLTVP